MKRNDFATFLAYVGMIAVALLVGFLGIKPIIDAHSSALPINSILLVLLSLVAGVILNALFLGLGHLLGAKTGRYRVLKFSVLGLGFKAEENGKRKFGFNSFQGLVEETKVVPENPKTSTLTGYVFFPVLFLFLEVIACMIGITLGQRAETSTPSMAWVRIVLITILTSGGIIFLYDLIPARIDSVTDGYILVLLSKPINKEAYNHLLIAEEASFYSKPIPQMPIYDDVTEFTASFNMLAIYNHLLEFKTQEAVVELDKIASEESKASKATKLQAKFLKLTALLEGKDKKGAQAIYEELSDEDKHILSGIPNLVCLRAYFLIASFLEPDNAEANYALDKAEKQVKACPEEYREAEKSLLQFDVDFCKKEHPSWKLDPLPWEEEESAKTE